MPSHDIIVVGASAGGVDGLVALTEELPADLRAAVFVVLHTTPYRPSRLPQVLGQLAPLPVAFARHGEPVRHGRIYVAPPDFHLLVRNGTVALSHGPKENGTRPAIDPLFLSAARAYGPRVAAVILSGTPGDGTSGMMAVKAHGGVGIVQIPGEATFPRMPLTAIRHAQPDHVLPLADIGPLLVRLAGALASTEESTAMPDPSARAIAMIHDDLDAQSEGRLEVGRSVYSCPHCGGALWQTDEGLIRFRCHVGHTASPEDLLVQKTDDLERSLWACVRTLTEKAILTRQLAALARAEGRPEAAARIEASAALDEEHIHLLRESVLEANPNPTSQLIEIQRALEPDEDETPPGAP
ncbi:MAG TPA: chemotaxis protein CheB [Isosphaeraceae bacterium]|jgi:two-component system chemotaxis response regulator CheB